jgi:phage shock protein PspC (stress-responsive transcriptional regulator)
MTSSPLSTDQPQPTNSTTIRPPLQRSRTDLMLGGVSGGLAEHTGTDALLWRVAFAGLVVAGGAGIPIYLLLWVLMPPAPAGPADKTNVFDEWVERLRGRLSSNHTAPPAG